MNELAIKELMRSKEEKRILTGRISGIEDEYYKVKNEYIPCAILWYEDVKVLIPSTHLGISKINKSMIRGMLGAEIDFIVIEIDDISNIAIASRKDAVVFTFKANSSEDKFKIDIAQLVKKYGTKIKFSAGIKPMITLDIGTSSERKILNDTTEFVKYLLG